jgi:hypothetical protein
MSAAERRGDHGAGELKGAGASPGEAVMQWIAWRLTLVLAPWESLYILYEL